MIRIDDIDLVLVDVIDSVVLDQVDRFARNQLMRNWSGSEITEKFSESTCLFVVQVEEVEIERWRKCRVS